jgi:hypothetical protein
VLKQPGSRWRPNDRSGAWLKLKPDYIHVRLQLLLCRRAHMSVNLAMAVFARPSLSYWMSCQASLHRHLHALTSTSCQLLSPHVILPHARWITAALFHCACAGARN